MESISDVVDEVIQNCPIDVRRPLYKVRALFAPALKVLATDDACHHPCSSWDCSSVTERSGMFGNMTLPTEGFLKLSSSFFPFFLNPGWPRFRTCDFSVSTSLALGFQARISMPGLSYLFFSGKLDLKLDSLSHTY